jgi:hypothetical protein
MLTYKNSFWGKIVDGKISSYPVEAAETLKEKRRKNGVAE